MKLIRTVDAAGQVLCHDITQIIPGEFKGARFKKGHIIQPEDIPVLLSIGKENLYVWEKKPGILHEDEAAALLYKAAAGKNIHGTEPKEGKIELIADCDGLLKIDRDTALMTSTGSAICGAAAVLGAEPVVKCEGYKTAIAVSTVVIFGTLSMFLYPVMYRMGMLNGMTDTEVAVYTGSTLHEVAHVAGAGNAMDPTDALGIAGTATITKMIRVMLLAPVLVIMGFVLAGRRKESGGETGKRRIAVPWFAFGFIGIICLNSLLQYLFGVESVREIPLNGAIEYADTFLLTMAMTALGTETSIDKFRQAGAKPFVLAGLLYVWLVAGGYFVTKYVVGML